MEPTLSTIKRLFAASGNLCSFPQCSSPIVENTGTVTGIICHIKARSRGGPRYDSKQTDQQRHGFDNLILMCARHSKLIDSEPRKFTVALLLEMKEMHERAGSIDLRMGDSAKSEQLLADYRNFYSINAGGHVMVNSPGSIQAETVNVKIEKKTIKFHPPNDTIASDRSKRNYIKHLIDQYHTFASKQSDRLFSYPAIYAEIRKTFGAKWDHISIQLFERLCRHLQDRIDRTMIGRINRSKGQSNYSTYQQYLSKYESL
jgi:hypothetical protein